MMDGYRLQKKESYCIMIFELLNYIHNTYTTSDNNHTSLQKYQLHERLSIIHSITTQYSVVFKNATGILPAHPNPHI